MINLKQTELSHQLFNQLKQHYPEIEWVDIVESGIYPDHLWVKVIMPEDEEREIEMGHLAAEVVWILERSCTSTRKRKY